MDYRNMSNSELEDLYVYFDKLFWINMEVVDRVRKSSDTIQEEINRIRVEMDDRKERG